MGPDSRPPSTRAHIISAIVILLGAVVSLLPASGFAMYLGLHRYRMVCTPQTGYGSGCYEGELMIVSVLFGAFYLMCAIFSSIITGAYRYNLTTRRKWWPFAVFCILVLLTVAVVAFNFATGPRQYP